MRRGSPVAAGDEKQIVLPDALVDQQGLEDFRIEIEEKGFDQGVAAAFGGGDPLPEGELIDAANEEGIDGPADGGGHLDVDGQPHQVGPVEVVNKLDRVRLGRLLEADQPQPYGVECGEALGLRHDLTNGGGDVRVIENRESLVLHEIAYVFFHELRKLFAGKRLDVLPGVHRV